jgi:hypothetical protein
LEWELERSDTVVAEALGETFRARERETALMWHVRELEAMLGVGVGTGGVDKIAGADVGAKLPVDVGVEKKVDNAVREGEVLRQRLDKRLDKTMKERDEAMRLLAEVRKVLHMVGGGVGTISA